MVKSVEIIVKLVKIKTHKRFVGKSEQAREPFMKSQGKCPLLRTHNVGDEIHGDI